MVKFIEHFKLSLIIIIIIILHICWGCAFESIFVSLLWFAEKYSNMFNWPAEQVSK